MKLIRLIVIVAVVGFASGREPLTLQQMSKLWLVDGWGMKEFGVYAVNYKRQTVLIGWGLLDNYAWIPFAAQTYFDGKSSGNIKVITEIGVTNGLCRVQSRRIKADLTTYFTSQPVSIWPVDPNRSSNEIMEPIVVVDPNEYSKIDYKAFAVELIESDPNKYAPFLHLLDDLKGDPNTI